MTTLTIPLMALALLLLVLIVATCCYSLRGFSRSRLKEICERNGHDTRFLEILRYWDTALVATEAFYALSVLAFTSLVLSSWNLLIPRDAIPTTTAEWFNACMKWVALVATLAFTGIMLPRSIARVTGESVLARMWPLIQTATFVLRPAVEFGVWVDRLLHRLYALDEPNPDDPETLTEEIRTVLEAGERVGAINSNASSMIDQVMDLKDANVASVMTPRTEICTVHAEMNFEEALRVVLEAGHTRMPLIGKSPDDIVGILYAKDLLKCMEPREGDAPELTAIAREALYVPETTSVENLLETMNRKRVHMAIVLDEYGGVAGLVTMEDLLEEIVGEIVDEYDDEEDDPIRRLSPDVIEVDARVHVDDLVEEFDYSLPDDRDFDTIGGFVFSHLGYIPATDEIFEWSGLRFTVLDADKRRVLRLRIERDESLSAASHDE